MKNLLSLILLTTLLFSCQKSKENAEDTQAVSSFEAERTAFFNNLKTPADAAANLQATGADFNAALMSNPGNFAAFANNPEKAAANLGLFLSDLNYSVAYGQGSKTQGLFSAAYELSKSIGLEQGMLDFLMKRYSENLAQNDSVKTVVNTLFDKSTAGLQGTERERLIGIAMAAYQIENLHLALGIIESYPKDMLPTDTRTQILVPVYRMVLDQKGNVENIYGFLKSISDPEKNPNYPYYSNAFEELIGVYNRLNIEEKIANNQALELMSDAVAKELNEKVDAIRNKIASTE
ncbi:MAG: hypothetical protein AABY93_12090 [Bacteroidota bacterium]